MASLNDDLKSGQLKSVYLLYGEEDYLKEQYRDRIKKAILPEDDTMNFAQFEGADIDQTEIIDLAETMPFFADRRLILVEDSGFFKKASPELADYIKEMPDTTCLVFMESEVDKRGKLYKAVKEKGRVVECKPQDEQTLLYWIAVQVKKENKQIRESTARYLLEKVGTDMENLEQELQKVFAYAQDEDEITVADIDAICTTQVTNKIFDMVEAVAKKQQKKALAYYEDLLALKEAPMRILFLLTRQYRQLMQVKDLMRQGFGKAQIAEKAGVPGFAAKKYMDQCRMYTQEQLRAILEDAAELEEAVKTGHLGDRMSVELFIVKYSTAAA